jgi:hypothetical protein
MHAFLTQLCSKPHFLLCNNPATKVTGEIQTFVFSMAAVEKSDRFEMTSGLKTGVASSPDTKKLSRRGRPAADVN